MATHTAAPAPARTDAGQMCQAGGPSLWVRDPGSGELRRTDPASRVWAEHPVSGALVRIRSWRDVRDLDRGCRRAGTPWEQLVVVTDALASPAEVRASLAGEGPWPAVHTDEESARGRLWLEVFGPADPVNPVEWVAELAADQKRLRQLGAAHVAHTLFGEKTRRDILAGLGAALLDRGPLGRLRNRHVVVALAAAAADLLSADEIAEVLAWPAPNDQLSARAAKNLRTVLGLLPPRRRLRFLESVMVRALDEPSSPDERARYYEYDGFRGDEWDPARRLGSWGDPVLAELTAVQERYMRSVQEVISAAGAKWLYVTENGRVQSSPFGCFEDRLEFAAFATEQYVSRVGPLPKSTGDVEADSRRLVDEVFPGFRRWIWDTQLLATLGQSVPGVLGSQIVLPSDESDLARWGRTMGNCIGARDIGEDYVWNIERKGDVVGAVTVDGRVEVTFELRNETSRYKVGQVEARFNNDSRALLTPVIQHLSKVAEDLHGGFAPARKMPPRIHGHAEVGSTNVVTIPGLVEQLEEAMDERFVARCRRTGGGRRRNRRARPMAPVEVLARIASDPQMSRIAAEAMESMEPVAQAALAFGSSPERSLADVLRIAAAVSPADAWIVPGAGPFLVELVDEFDSTEPERLALRWDEISPFGHSPKVDDAVRAALVATLDGSLGESLVSALDRDGESLAARSPWAARGLAS